MGDTVNFVRSSIRIGAILAYFSSDTAKKQAVNELHGAPTEAAPEKFGVFVEQLCGGHILRLVDKFLPGGTVLTAANQWFRQKPPVHPVVQQPHVQIPVLPPLHHRSVETAHAQKILPPQERGNADVVAARQIPG